MPLSIIGVLSQWAPRLAEVLSGQSWAVALPWSGCVYGARVAVSIPTASELFGLESYGLMYNLLILNVPLGSFLFSGVLAGILIK
ncbi:hypothetical protein EJ110_NYTH17856 [Nymphaea thermarum]|nr:hypothetical protein EJ110_NYTH17856 [Nymphaea thermarum]